MAALEANQVVPTKQSSDAEWIAYYELLPGDKKSKNTIFLATWRARKGDKANTSTLRAYLIKNGIDIQADNELGNLVDSGTGFLSNVANSMKVPTYLLIVFIGLFGLTALFILIRLSTPQNAGILVGTAAKTYGV